MYFLRSINEDDEEQMTRFHAIIKTRLISSSEVRYLIYLY
jgi:hypothetical protein